MAEYQNIYILAAASVREKSKEDLEKECEKFWADHPKWNEWPLEHWTNWMEARGDLEKCEISASDCAYFLDEETAAKFAKENMGDIDERGSNNYLVLYSRVVGKMYPETVPGVCRIFVFNQEKGKYEEIKDIGASVPATELKKEYDVFCKAGKIIGTN